MPSEAAMQEAIEKAVTLRGGRLFHLNDARTAPELEDLSDLIVVVPGFAALAELKSQRRTTTQGQLELAMLLSTVTRFWGGIVRPAPRDGEVSYDDFLAMIERAA
jgi:hypothetical protein